MECSWCDDSESVLFLLNLILPRLLATASPSIAASPSVNLTDFSSLGLYARMTAPGSTIVNEELADIQKYPRITKCTHVRHCSHARMTIGYYRDSCPLCLFRGTCCPTLRQG